MIKAFFICVGIVITIISKGLMWELTGIGFIIIPLLFKKNTKKIRRLTYRQMYGK